MSNENLWDIANALGPLSDDFEEEHDNGQSSVNYNHYYIIIVCTMVALFCAILLIIRRRCRQRSVTLGMPILSDIEMVDFTHAHSGDIIKKNINLPRVEKILTDTVLESESVQLPSQSIDCTTLNVLHAAVEGKIYSRLERIDCLINNVSQVLDLQPTSIPNVSFEK